MTDATVLFSHPEKIIFAIIFGLLKDQTEIVDRYTLWILNSTLKDSKS